MDEFSAKSARIEHPQTYKKLSGTSDDGRVFEKLTVANLSLDLIFNNKIENFSLSSNEDTMGAFDDIVINLQHADKTEETIGIQLKYRLGKNKVLTKQMLVNSKDFKLKKYCDAYHSIKNFTGILYARLNFDDQRDGTDFSIEGEEEAIYFTVTKMPKVHDFFRETDPECCCYKFTINDSKTGESQRVAEYKTFFENFFLYSTQIDVDAIKLQICDKLKKRFSAGAGCRAYVDFVHNWFSEQRRSIRLDKKFLKRVLGLGLLDLFITTLRFDGVATEKKSLFLEACSQFPVTLLGEERKEEIRGLCCVPEDKFLGSQDFEIMLRNYQIKEYSLDEKRTRVLWLTNECPLIVTDNEIVRNVIVLCPEMKFILLFKNFGDVANVKGFFSLADLDVVPELAQKIVSTFQCRLQDKTVTLAALVGVSEDVRRVVTTNELVLMLGPGNSLNIGEVKEVLPAVYVKRFFAKVIITDRFVNEADEDTKILITGLSHNLKENFRNNSNVFAESDVLDFQEFCVQNVRKQCHLLRFFSEDNFEWLHSNCSTSALKSCTSTNHELFTKEDDVSSYEKFANVNVVCGAPGIGKTICMKNLLKTCPPALWTIFLYTRNHSKHFREKGANINEFIAYILREHKKEYKPFDYELFKIFIKTGKIRFLWDGVDELNSSNFDVVKTIISNLKNQKHWITSRDILKEELEKNFHVVSRTLRPFNEQEQKRYIKDRLNLCDQEITDIYDKISQNIQLFPCNNILEIPLQIFILTELFNQNKKKYLKLLDGVFSIADLYEHFVEEKFKIFHIEKENITQENDYILERNEKLKNEQLDFYEKIAMQLYFEKNNLATLDVQCDAMLNEIKTKFDKLGFIVQIATDNLPEFVHNSFGEFFAACYLAKSSGKISHFETFFFEEKYNNVRFFLDLILTKNCKAHVATLYQNWQLMETCAEEDFASEDGGGRTPLHIMCSWGGFGFNKNAKYTKLKPDFIKWLERVSLNPWKKDRIFNLNCFNYTLKSKCFLTLGVLTAMSKTISEEFEAKKKEILDVCLLHDYARILKTMFQEMHSLVIKKNILSWHHVRCFYPKQFIKEIALRTNDQNDIDHRGYFYVSIVEGDVENVELFIQNGGDLNFSTKNGTPLHFACGYDDSKILKLLIVGGANVNLAAAGGWTPLHKVCQCGHINHVKLFIECGANVNIEDDYGQTALHFAYRSHYKNFKIIELLQQNGAKVNVKDKKGQIPDADPVTKPRKPRIPLFGRMEANDIDEEGNTLIYNACKSGKTHITKALIDAGADVNLQNPEGNTPLHVACKLDKTAIVKLLLDNASHVNVQNDELKTPLHDACHYGYIDIVKLLVDNNADVNIEDIEGKKPLHHACICGQSEIVKLLIAHGANVNVKYKKHKSPMHDACDFNKCHIVKLLIDYKADVNAKDNEDKTPIHNACKFATCKTVKLLIENGADINIPDQEIKTPIHNACQFGKTDIVELLIEKGANVNVIDIDGKTPMHNACKFGWTKIVKILNKANVKADDLAIRSACYKSFTEIVKLLIAGRGEGVILMHDACNSEHENTEVVKLLIENGEQVNVQDCNGGTPIHNTCKFGKIELLKLLIDKGANVNVLDKDGKTPMHDACKLGRIEILNLLIDGGANVNAEDREKKTPLHIACYYGYLNIVKLLIEKGAKVNALDKEGRTPMHDACYYGFSTIVQLLIEKEANVNIEDEKGKTVLHKACFYKHFDTVKLLVVNKANVDVKDRQGNTPMDDALINNFTYNKRDVDRIVELLKRQRKT